MFNRGSNVFVSYLKSAKVKHTNAFANKISVSYTHLTLPTT